MKKLSFTLSLLIAFSFAAFAQDENEVLQTATSWTDALQKAKAENKLLFIDTYFTGCLPCAQMDKEVFPNKQVAKELGENFVAVKVNVFKEKLGDTLNRKFVLSGYPTFLVVHPTGGLVSHFSGFKDAGLFLAELNEAKAKASQKEFASGFSLSYVDNYPEFYNAIYNKDEKKWEPAAINAWIKTQKDWTSEPVAVSIFRTRKLDKEIEQYFVKNYAKYRSLYGEGLATEKLATILTAQLTEAVSAKKDGAVFEEFIKMNAKKFPKEDWPVVEHLLAYNYYGSIAKDTVSLLKFMSEHPLIHQNYFGALYNMMLVKKQINETTLPYLQAWADRAINEESAFDIIRTAAYINQRAKDEVRYKKFVSMLIRKAGKYDVPGESYQKMLAANF